MRSKHFRILILIVFSLTVLVGIMITSETGMKESNLNDQEKTEKVTISTGSMPADSVKERSRMRKMTSMENYEPNDKQRIDCQN